MSHRGGRNFNPGRQPSGRGRSVTVARGGNYHRPPDACRNFVFQPDCPYGQSCKFQHRVREVGYYKGAHKHNIYCLAVGPLPGVAGAYQLFTGGKDQTVKRWSITPLNTSQPTHIPGGLLPSDALANPNISQQDSIVFYDIKEENTTVFPDQVTAVMLAADCLFCGLGNGLVRGFVSATGHSFDLQGHQAAVHAMALVDQILITGDFDGLLCFWQPGRDEQGRPLFNLASRLNLPSAITVIKEILVPSNEGPVKTLWLGCVGRVCVIHLQTMQVVSTYVLPQHPRVQKVDFCMSLVPFGNSVLVAAVSGKVYQLTHNCQVEREEKTEEVMCMEGVMSASGPMLCTGSPQGWMVWMKLPTCQEEMRLDAHRDGIRAMTVVDPSAYRGMPPAIPFTVTVTEGGDIGLWSLSHSSKRRPGDTPKKPSRGRGNNRRY